MFEHDSAELSARRHVLGFASEEVRSLPEFPAEGLTKEARRNFSEAEKLALIEEPGDASNKRKLRIKGTHYENNSTSEIAQMIMPLKGL